MNTVTARFIGGPLDGEVKVVGANYDAFDAVEEKLADHLKVFRYRRHLLTQPVGPEMASAVFVSADLGEAEAHRVILEALRLRR